MPGPACRRLLSASAPLIAAVIWIASASRPPALDARQARTPAQGQAVTPTVGMVITQSTRLAPGRYRLAAPADGPAIRIAAPGVTLDLTGVVLEGGDPLADPDGYTGTGIAVDDVADVTIRGGAVRGFKVGLIARRTPRLHLTGTDLSYNWKARLWSGIERESLVDWMSYHDNEQDEWLRYGAAIYLSDCRSCEVDHVRVVQGQNGLMVTRSSGLRVWNNTFSWNSGVGIGLYRTTDSVIQHNQVDWDVRGYSHGFYYRGQDSTAILLYQQSSRNTVAYNSFTHGGDGVFLWAGQSTMDTGQGGANDNLFYGNDVSHAVANGIKATFSRNRFIANRIEDCWHGVWGGYSFDSTFARNRFVRNDEGLAIEHGQDIRIIENTFDGDRTAIRLWANATQDPSWGYAKARDTRSRDYLIVDNRFANHDVVLDVMRTTGVEVGDNRFGDVKVPLRAGIDVSGLLWEPRRRDRKELDFSAVAPMPGARDAMLPDGARRGRATIIVDEWGPYDYRSPKLWPAGKPTDRPLKLRVLGPEGAWKLVSVRGARLDADSGGVPGTVTVTPTGRNADVDLRLDYVGGAVVTSRGVEYAAGTPVPFGYTLFEPAIDWTVRAWTFDEASDPVTAPAAFAARLETAPVRTERLPRLGWISGGVFLPDLPRDRVALRAEGRVDLPPGDYDLQVISDDGVRVWVDDRLVLDRWDVHESVVARVPVTGGRHRIRLDYFEMTGWAELQVRFARR